MKHCFQIKYILQCSAELSPGFLQCIVMQENNRGRMGCVQLLLCPYDRCHLKYHQAFLENREERNEEERVKLIEWKVVAKGED